MPTYPPPDQNPKCICPTRWAAFFCMTGHMLECHYPMSCQEAECSHYEREVAAVENELLDLLGGSDDVNTDD